MEPNQQHSQQIPQPAGTDDNGNPFWIIDGRQVSWADMQQYLWEQQQNVPQQVTPAGGGGFEAIPQMPMPEVAPNIPATPERGPELGIEQGMERKVEVVQEQSIEQPQEQGQQAQAPAQNKSKAKSHVGDSHELETIDTTSPVSMHNYAAQHKKDPKTNSSRFLSEFFSKLLKILSLSKP